MLLPAFAASLASGDRTPPVAGSPIVFWNIINNMAKQGKRGLRRLLDAAGYSAAGLAVAWRGEEAFRQEVLMAVVLVPLALWLGQSNLERMLLVASWLMVMIVEILNTAVEATVDRISDEQHRLSGQAKDLGSAAVFLSLLLAALVWGTVAWERFAT
jgi:diacylglycerol kinase (ATP)